VADQELTVGINGNAESALAALRSVGMGAKEMGSTIVAVIAAVGLTKFLEESAKAAAADEQQMARLSTAITNTGVSLSAYKGRIEETEAANVKLGITHEETLKSLGTLTTMTGDAGKALQLETLATNVAAYGQMDLAKASTLVARVAEGKIGIAARYLPFLKSTMTSEEALAAMEQRLGGQAAARADTEVGANLRLKATTDALQDQVGNRLLPILRDFENDAADILQWFMDLPEPIRNNTESFLALGAAILVVKNAAMGLAAVKGLGALGGAGAAAGAGAASGGAAAPTAGVLSGVLSGMQASGQFVQMRSAQDLAVSGKFLGLVQLPSLFHGTAAAAKAAADATNSVAAANGTLAASQPPVIDGIQLQASDLDAAAKAADSLDTATVTWVRDMKGALAPSTSLSGAIRDLRNKEDALKVATLGAYDAHKASTAAKKTYGPTSVQYGAALAQEDQANLKVKDSQHEVAAAVQLVERRQNAAKSTMDSYTGKMGTLADNASTAASELAKIGIPGGIMTAWTMPKKARGGISTGQETITWGEDGTEVIIPVGNPKYRSEALGLLDYANKAVGKGNARGDIGGEGDGHDLATAIANLASSEHAGMGALGTLSSNIKWLGMMGGPVGKAEVAAHAAVGHPYVWGAAGPNSFDCSGLDSWVLGAAFGGKYGRFTTADMPGMFSPGKGQMITMGLIPGHHTGIELPDGWYEAAHTGTNVRGPRDAKSSWPSYWHIPGYDGGGVVPHDQMAYVHAGETIRTPQQEREIGGFTYAPTVYVTADSMTDINAMRAEVYAALEDNSRNAHAIYLSGGNS